MAKPIQGFRVGNVKAAIWANDSSNGTRYNATFQRAYDHDGRWKTSASFGKEDLRSLSGVADMARNWIVQKERRDRHGG